METIKINRKNKDLYIPEPLALWDASKKERQEFIRYAKTRWAEFRISFGFVFPKNVLQLIFGTTPTNNQKYRKSSKGDSENNPGTLIYGLSLAQNNLSGINVCHWSSPECRKACVGNNGNNGFPAVMRAKIAKTRFLFEHPEEASMLLVDLWDRAAKKVREGFEVGGRLNTFSDINWIEAAEWIFEQYKDIQFYDYTKDWSRETEFENYHLTYSASERTTDDEIIEYVQNGKNVAVVFSDWRYLPTEYLGLQVIDGDENDERWKDPKGVIVGLRRKGSLRKDSPMVRKVVPV